MKKYDTVIIGSGPAGLSAAVYLKRGGLDVCIIEKQGFSGGQILLTSIVENYLGFSSITGDALADKFFRHAHELGTDFLTDEAEKVDKNKVILKSGKSLLFDHLIIATGSSHKTLDVLGEKEFAAKGISYCALCDGALFSGKEVIVIGGGDTALEEAFYLAKTCKKVTLIHRRSTLRASKILQNRFFSLNNTQFIANDEIKQFCGETTLNAVILKSGKRINTSGAFIAIGQNPQNNLIKDIVKLDNQGYIITDDYCKTSVSGIYAIGDIRSKNCRQIITAAADGAIAAHSILQ